MYLFFIIIALQPAFFYIVGQDVKPQELEDIFQATFELANKQGKLGKPSSSTSTVDKGVGKKSSSTKKGEEEEQAEKKKKQRSSTENDAPSIDWATFTAIMNTPIEEDDVKKVFKLLDTSCSGTIAVSDLTQMMEVLTDNSEKLSESQIASLLSLAEVKDSQKITFEQFKKWWI